jgi:phosphatidylethanolamine-binding protein (PEBP) family uncharacterized protein
MAQRTGTDGLIASVSKATSARASLALVVAVALALSGCGGDSGPETASAPASSATTTADSKQVPTSSSGSTTSKPSSAPGQGPAADTTKTAGGKTAASPAPGAKHGTPVTLPKGPREPEPTPAQQAQATVASMSLSSPAVQPIAATGESLLPATYTCDGNDSWPALQWQGTPASTRELVLFVMNIEPVDEALFFDWAVAGIDPSLNGLEAARLPKGVVSGRNSFGHLGYSICPSQGKSETYIFALYAIPKALSPKQGFDPAALRKEVLGEAGNTGLMAATYTRG